MNTFWEIVVFAVIALALISALIDMLGRVDEADPAKSKSFFGEPACNIKEVYGQEIKSSINSRPHTIKESIEQFKELVYADNHKDKLKIINDLFALSSKIPLFRPDKFLINASKAALMIIKALKNNDKEVLNHLVDKRFIDDLQSEKYDKLGLDHPLAAKISEIYQFGNSVFIKIMFEFSKGLWEEWSFTKSMLNSNNLWQLSNINRNI